jgi:hypothetical protein
MDWCELPSPPSPSRLVSPRAGRGLASPRLHRLAHGRARDVAEQQAGEHCELCGAPVPRDHRHVLDVQTRQLMCACRPCSILFDRDAAGGGHYRLVPERRLRLDDLELSDIAWEELQIPVDMAFFFHSTAAGRVMAFYPSPMGPTESRLELAAWEEIEDANPVLADMEPDVEALLVNRARGARRQWLVPIDDCYRLVAVIRTRWRGFTGGKEVWLELERFFDDLDRRSRSLAHERRPDGPIRQR